ncbi:10719_t:CDS:2 [Paraglomus occultum]|uniref:10719_t:CDS:1 n=1 Tax=Paraglomus occultum TaxID=144539 RepID=A0A9N9A7N7_9GLOM|nr:10719_t:CDS:2 [Paraglomus occultum]
MTKITNEQKNKILQDLSSKNEWKAVQEAGSLIEKINDVEDERMPGEIYSNLLTDERLKDIQNPQPNSNLQKAVQALRDNGADLALDELIDHEKRKREIRINRRQERNIYQSMVDIKDVEMEHFDPHDYSSSSTTSSSIFQSMVEGVTVKSITENEISKNTSEPDLKDIKREIDILKNLRNKHIIQYYDTYSNDQELLIIMDYAENGTLTKFIDDNKDKKHN